MNSSTTPATQPNKKLYNGGSEWQNDYVDLPDYYQTFFRNYDAALGRWIGVDPMADAVESMSPYQYAGNNPGMINDPMGDLFDINTPTGTSDNRAAMDRTYQEVQSMVYSAQGWTGAMDFADWTPEAQKGEGGGGGGHFKTWDEVAEAVGRLQSTDSGGALNFAHGGYATSGTDVYGYATELDGITAGAATMARNGAYGKYDGWAKSYADAVDNYNIANHTNYFIGNTSALQSVGVWNYNAGEDGIAATFHSVNVNTGEDAEAVVSAGMGSYVGFSANFAFIGGFGIAVGEVTDANGNTKPYFTFSGNIGFGLGWGLDAGFIKPNGSHKFTTSDFAGKSAAYTVGIATPLMDMGSSYAGTVDENWNSRDKFKPRLFGQTDNGYTVQQASFNGPFSLGKKGWGASAMYSIETTWVKK